MTIEGLAYMNSMFESLGIPYEFELWNSPDIPNTYWVGEYIEIEPMTEDGYEETTFIITGTTNQKIIDLETVKQRIKDRLGCDGETAILDSGSGIAVLYVGSQNLPSVEDGVHRLQITMKIKEWRV